MKRGRRDDVFRFYGCFRVPPNGVLAKPSGGNPQTLVYHGHTNAYNGEIANWKYSLS